jgi:hypothetical protein
MSADDHERSGRLVQRIADLHTLAQIEMAEILSEIRARKSGEEQIDVAATVSAAEVRAEPRVVEERVVGGGRGRGVTHAPTVEGDLPAGDAS